MSKSETADASRTQLPPSPEIKGMIGSLDDDDDDLLMEPSLLASTSSGATRRPGSKHNNKKDSSTSMIMSRLQSISRYERFRPTTLACSPPLVSSSSSSSSSTSSNNPLEQGNSTSAAAAAAPHTTDAPLTSLGALAGSQGVVLFRVSTPQTPLLVLSHTYRSIPSSSVSQNTSSTSIKADGGGGGGIASMAFQASSSSLHLAAARGNGILVWDASGHSLNPLIARMGVGGSSTTATGDSTDNSRGRVLSIDWFAQGNGGGGGGVSQQQPAAAQRPPSSWLVGATSSSAYLWDLRDSASGSSSSSSASSSSLFAKPSLRFGGGQLDSNYIQLACSSTSIECALLDSNGMVRVFDLRMTSTYNHRPLLEVRTHDLAGIGIVHLTTSSSSSSSSSNRSRWVTWGMDSVVGNPVVRMWDPQQESTIATSNDASLSSLLDASIVLVDSPNASGWNLTWECEMPNLACVRVCPATEDTLVLVSQGPLATTTTTTTTTSSSTAAGPLGNNLDPSWSVDLWSVTSNGEKERRMTKKATFQAGQDASQQIMNMLGPDVKLGSLYASDLALSTVPRLVEREDEDYALVEERQEPGVLLLSLTDTGFLTSHVIPEAVPSKMKSVEKVTSSSDYFRSTFGGSQARIYPDGKDLALGDVAWSVVQDDSHRPLVRENSYMASANQTPNVVDPMQFDLDDAAVFSSVDGDRPSFQAAQDTLISQEKASEAGNLASQETSDSAAVELMKKIETRNIPCPRLCGATFGPAVGGLVSFHNGEVRKMWRWYIGDTTTGSLRDHEQSGPDSGMRDTVRTLKDLFDMMKASKESQWGDQADSDASSDAQNQLNDDFFEDESESSDSGEPSDDDLVEVDDDDPKGSKNMFNSYTSEQSTSKSVSVASQDDVAEPSSDILSPHVSIFQHINVTSLNRQSPELAFRLKLGPWWTSLGNTPSLDRDLANSGVSLDMLSSTGSSKSRPNLLSEQGSFGKFGFARQHGALTGVFSDPLIVARPAGPTMGLQEERPVHGGEYSIRPNMQESVDFLRKLFTHQQEGGDTPGIGDSMSPPDKPLLPPSPGRNRKINPTLGQANLIGPENGEAVNSPKPGVYTYRPKEFLSQEAKGRLFETRFLCSHNANVSREAGHHQKADVWDVLTQMVDGRLAGSGSLWNQKLKTTLTSSFIANTLRYHEKIGDVQMLAHMICVLRIPTADLSPREKVYCTFLPSYFDQRYDSAIRMYARILYAWGLLSHHAELNKHLLLVPEDPLQAPFQTSVESIECLVCGQKNSTGSITCKSCNDYMFRCVICENAVRGLFTFCIICGHGGHILHMTEFFQQCTECPSGCGCNCVLFSTQKQERILAPRFVQNTSSD